ncbi:MAG: NAD(P)H-dependent glycerol-3-phosphate dehydrogenase [Lachnospiraceae bacterium]|nr:NAD(P)H-dependent glycerol-3-phosphate dehydrogenase [Lachnospiraceae bacterium]
MAQVSIIGTGTWGIALGIMLAENGHQVTAWSAIPAEIEQLKATYSCKNLPGVRIPDSITFTTSLEEACTKKELLVLSVPSVFTRGVARQMKPFVKEGQLIVDVAKGIEESTLMTMSQQIEEELSMANVAVLSGPSHAEEVSRKIPTTCVAGARDKETAQTVQNFFMSPVFRIYTSPDIIGIELGGALKNVIALAAGISDGLGCGDNTKAALMTRGIAEISRLGVKMGGHPETFSGLSGIGDLIVTCTSMHSRNRRAGILIGQGKSMQEAMDEVQMVVEGVYSAKAALALGKKYGVSLPIIEQVNAVLFDGKSAKEALADLMGRDKTAEADFSSVEW